MRTKQRQIQIFTTGGTIDKVDFDAKGGYEVGESIVPDILKQGRVQIDFAIAEILRKDIGRAINYDIGIKGDLLGHPLTVDASAYYIAWKDIQLQELSPYYAYFLC